MGSAAAPHSARRKMKHQAKHPKKQTRKPPLRVGVLDFFCGSGGVSYGFLQAKVPGVEVEIIAGIDRDEHCCATYERMIGSPAECIDVANLVDNPALLLAAARRWRIRQYDRLVLIGCSPCQGFAAHRQSFTAEDMRRDLLVMFSEIVSRLKPDAAIMENVPDLFSKKHWPFFEKAKENLEAAGLRVRARAYNFATFGLPQERFRAVIMAMKKQFAMPVGNLSPVQFRTVRDTIGHLPPLGAGEKDPNDAMHMVSNHRANTVQIIAQVPKNGGNRPVGVGPKCLDRARETHGGYTDVYGRMAWDRPSVTLTGKCRTPSAGRYAHPEQNRGLSIREAALLQGFPPEYMFEGTFDSRYLQIGNAVPPLVSKVFAEHILTTLLHDRPANTPDEDTTGDISTPVGPGFAVTIHGLKKKRDRKEAATL